MMNTAYSKFPFRYDDYKSILCLNGILPEKSFFDLPLPIIAADGAANQLLQLGIVPSLVIGDLDSVDPGALAQLTTYYHEDQDHCDFQKSLWYLTKHALVPTIIVGISGGALDHILNNINLFLNGHNLLYAPPVYGMVMRGEEKNLLQLMPNTKISLLGIPSASVKTTGLEWDLNHCVLAFPGKNSCFNRVKQGPIEIHVSEGTLLVLIHC